LIFARLCANQTPAFWQKSGAQMATQARPGIGCTGFQSALRKPWPAQNTGVVPASALAGHRQPWDITRKPMLLFRFPGSFLFR